MVHFYRNVFSHVPTGKLREVALMLKAIHAQEDIAAAQRKAGEVVARLHSMRLGKAAELVETAMPETLAYYAFPEEHWRRIRTNNPLERIMREIRRRTRVVGAFPDGNSAINLAAARLRHIAGTCWSTIRRVCLVHVVVLGEAHLRQLLATYTNCYNELRTPRPLTKGTPLHSIVERIGAVSSRSILASLHHHTAELDIR